MARREVILLLAQLLSACVCALKWEKCAGASSASLILHDASSAEPLVAGDEACLAFNISSSSHSFSHVSLTFGFPTISGSAGWIDTSLCESLTSAACPVGPGRIVAGELCGRLPLPAMVHAGQTIPMTLRAKTGDDGSADAGCWTLHATVAETISATAVELAAKAVPHQVLHRVVYGSDGHVLEDADGASLSVEHRLDEAYEALPEWQAAFESWRRSHGREYPRWRSMRDDGGARSHREGGLADGADREHDDLEANETPSHAGSAQAHTQPPTSRAAAAREEALGFLAFRENVLSAVRNGRRLSFDEHSDKRRDARATLKHFA